MIENKLLRSGTLEQTEPADADGKFAIKCLVHPQKRLPRPTLEQFKQWECCPQCLEEADALPNNAIRMVAKKYGGYVVLNSMGPGYKERRNNHSRHTFWRIYCDRCHKETVVRGDVIRNGKLPLCVCKKPKPVNEVVKGQGGEVNG